MRTKRKAPRKPTRPLADLAAEVAAVRVIVLAAAAADVDAALWLHYRMGGLGELLGQVTVALDQKR